MINGIKNNNMAREKQLYWVDCLLSNGMCYRSVSSCTWEEVKELRKLAKLLGETIKYEKM